MGLPQWVVAAEQKIVFIRHAEKPAQGLGQINCQGLNRALALPAVLLGKFGKPDFIFASDPHEKKPDGDQLYNYVRPLLTVAPTAVQAGLPINTSFGFENIEGLQQELAAPRYQNAVVFVAWEHRKLEDMVRAMLKDMGASPADVPRWKGSDFDSIYVVTVQRNEGKTIASFAHERQQLDGQAAACPVVAVPKPAAKP
ncbi:MAG: histidine phosphatase family protein [Polaromonas sp.]|nr:histidine phosphatase family protein [Polaromonas sp.]